jgi:hypothetical protein
MRTKWLASFVLLGLLLLGGASFFWPRPAQVSPEPRPVSLAAPAATPSLLPTPLESAKSFKNGEPMKRVMELYASESQRVGKIDKDPKATEARLEEDARELTPEEVEWLGKQATDIKNDGDARFFAEYMVGLSHQEAAVKVLAAIAVSPEPVTKNDRLLQQEQAFRASAVEGLSHNCKEFPAQVKSSFLDVVSRQQDEMVRDLAHRGLYACQTGKRLEDQVEQALQKVRTKK